MTRKKNLSLSAAARSYEHRIGLCETVNVGLVQRNGLSLIVLLF